MGEPVDRAVRELSRDVKERNLLFGAHESQAAEVAVSLANGQQPKSSGSISNGKRAVPAIFGPVVAVNKLNVNSTVIKDGFQNIASIRAALPPDKWPH